MHLSTTNFISGSEISEVLGIVRGSTVRAKHIGSDFMASLKTIVGGEISEYTKLLDEAREEAIKRMTEDAKNLAADAVIGVRFSTSSIMGGSAEIMVYGTAVKLK